MRPSNDHEVAIADIIDGFSLEGRLQLSIIPEVAAALASGADGQAHGRCCLQESAPEAGHSPVEECAEQRQWIVPGDRSFRLATEHPPEPRQPRDPGGSREADSLVKDFLGRPHSFAAYEAWLNQRT